MKLQFVHSMMKILYITIKVTAKYLIASYTNNSSEKSLKHRKVIKVKLTMINIAYLQTFITTGLLHPEQSLTQQRSLGWIKVSKAADVNIYYKPSSTKSLLTEALHMDLTSCPYRQLLLMTFLRIKQITFSL